MAAHSQVQRIEEEDQVFALVVRQFQLFKLSVDDGCSLPVWRRLRDWKEKEKVTSTRVVSTLMRVI